MADLTADDMKAMEEVVQMLETEPSNSPGPCSWVCQTSQPSEKSLHFWFLQSKRSHQRAADTRAG